MENANKEAEKSEKKANEKEKKSLIGKIKPDLSNVKNFFLWIVCVFLKFWNSKVFKYMRKKVKCISGKIVSTAFITFLLAIGTFLMAFYTRDLAKGNSDLIVSNNKMLDLTKKANSRSEKLFVAQNKPLVDVTPIGVIPGTAEDGNKMCTTMLSFTNYSGFIAKEISFDIKYGSKPWISEWIYADIDSKRKEKEDFDKDSKKENKEGVLKENEVELNRIYMSKRRIALKELKPGQTEKSYLDIKTGQKIKRDLDFPFLYATGQLDLNKEVVGKEEGFEIFVRFSWKSEYGHIFEKIKKYKLLCTKTGIGHSFSFFHEGIVSQTTYE